MILPDHWILYILLGVVGGVLGGALGIGSGIIVVPVLVFCAYAQKEAQGMALAVMVPMALYGAIRYAMSPGIHINFLVVGLIAAGALVGVYFGTSIAQALPGATLRKVFSVVLVFAAVRMYFMK